MIISVRKGQLTAGAPYWCEWTQRYFTEAYDTLKRSDSYTVEGSLDTDAKESLRCRYTMGYSRMTTRFDVDEKQMRDEEDTLIRLMDVLPTQKYVKMALMIIEPYTSLEFDEASLDRINQMEEK